MISVDKYNNLDKKKVSYKDLEEILYLAHLEDQFHVIDNITNLLNAYPSTTYFHLEVKPIKPKVLSKSKLIQKISDLIKKVDPADLLEVKNLLPIIESINEEKLPSEELKELPPVFEPILIAENIDPIIIKDISHPYRQDNKINKEPLKEPIEQNPIASNQIDAIYRPEIKSPRKGSLADRLQQKKTAEFFKLNEKYNDVSKFFGTLEKKEKESIAITLGGPQGGGKTRFLFQVMNAFADSGYRCAHISNEEHPDSTLYTEKAYEYLTPKALNNIDSQEISKNNLDYFEKMITENDLIFIDSFKKLAQIIHGLDMDNDLRKEYDGKIFFIIFQLNQDGSMKGGSDAQFDGDVILFNTKDEDYRKSFIWQDKNRYQKTPLHELKYNIYHKSMITADSNSKETKDPETIII